MRNANLLLPSSFDIDYDYHENWLTVPTYADEITERAVFHMQGSCMGEYLTLLGWGSRSIIGIQLGLLEYHYLLVTAMYEGSSSDMFYLEYGWGGAVDNGWHATGVCAKNFALLSTLC